MNIVDLPLDQLWEAEWNPNTMSPELLAKLKESINRYGVVENLVVRAKDRSYEVLSGNQRLGIYRGLGLVSAPCVVVDLDDGRAKLLAQALNRIHGEDDLGLRAELVREVLEAIPQEEVLSLLPDTASSLQALASLGQQTIAEHLMAWQEAQKAQLHHLSFQLTDNHLELVEEALGKFITPAKDLKGDNPNLRGTALYLLCKAFLEALLTPEADQTQCRGGRDGK